MRKRYEVANQKRAEVLRDISRRLANADLSRHAEAILREAATADDLREVYAAVDLLVARSDVPRETFRSVAEAWTSGDLHRKYPDHVRLKSSLHGDLTRLGVLYETIGNVSIRTFTFADAERAMAALPKTAKASATRRQYAQIISKVLRWCVFPLRLIPHSPLPDGWLPVVRNAKVTAWLYPDEDLQLLSCKEIPLEYRLLYGFLAREGCRLSEALRLTWADLDLKRGTLRLDDNKTDDPRMWALTTGVVAALRLLPHKATHVFDNTESKPARTFRKHLRVAGLVRPELFELTGARRPIRLHDLRATFITVSLAIGRSETWVADRTGHTSSVMIHRYRRAARQATELGLGDLTPLNEAIGQEIGQMSPAVEPIADELPY